MIRSRFLKVMLVIIAVLLALNLIQTHPKGSFRQKAVAGSYGIFDSISHIVCSADGAVVYLVSGKRLFRSQNHGLEWAELSCPAYIPPAR